MFPKTKALLSPFWRIEPSYGLAFAPIYMIEIPWIWIAEYWLKDRPIAALLVSYLVVGILLLPTAAALLVTLFVSTLALLPAPFVMIADCATEREQKPRPVVQRVESPAKSHVSKPLKFAPIVYAAPRSSE